MTLLRTPHHLTSGTDRGRVRVRHVCADSQGGPGAANMAHSTSQFGLSFAAGRALIPSVQSNVPPAQPAASSSAIFTVSDAAFVCLLALMSTALGYRFG